MWMRNRLRVTYTIVRNQLHLTIDQMKTRYDIRANSPKFSVRNHVWLYHPVYKKEHCLKLQKGWDELIVIVKPLNNIEYQIQKPRSQFDVNVSFI